MATFDATVVEAKRGRNVFAALRWVTLLMLCTAYLEGGIEKIGNFSGALAELQQFGVAPLPVLVLCSIAVELGGSALVLSGCYRWLGALGLSGFTLYASSLANRFWEAPPEIHGAMLHAFVEHIGLAGAFLLVALIDLLERYAYVTAFGAAISRCPVRKEKETLLLAVEHRAAGNSGRRKDD